MIQKVIDLFDLFASECSNKRFDIRIYCVT